MVAYLAVTIGRALVIATVRALLEPTRERFPWPWTTVLTWGGLRGALPMVLVLSLPATFAYRELLVSMTFGVVVLSILVQGVTMSVLLTRLGIVGVPADQTAYEIRIGRLQGAAAALQDLDRMSRMHLAAPEILDALRKEYRDRLERAEHDLQTSAMSSHGLRDREMRRMRRSLLVVERDQVTQAFHRGALGRRSQDGLLAEIDARLANLETGDELTGPCPEHDGAAGPRNAGAAPPSARITST